MAAPFYFPPAVSESFNFSTSSLALCAWGLVGGPYSDQVSQQTEVEEVNEEVNNSNYYGIREG